MEEEVSDVAPEERTSGKKERSNCLKNRNHL